MPKLITMREMLAGAPTGVPGLYGIGDYHVAGLAESTYSPYDQPGRSDRLWHHAAVGDIAPSSTGLPPAPAMNLPLDVTAIAHSMCTAAGKTWDDATKQCLDKPLEPPKKPFWTPMTTALVALGIVGIGAIWAFGGGKTKKRAKSNYGMQMLQIRPRSAQAWRWCVKARAGRRWTTLTPAMPHDAAEDYIRRSTDPRELRVMRCAPADPFGMERT
jgi:hypothetical protein